MHEPVLENRFGDHRGSVGNSQQRHDLRLKVGREARIRFGQHVDSREPLVGS